MLLARPGVHTAAGSGHAGSSAHSRPVKAASLGSSQASVRAANRLLSLSPSTGTLTVMPGVERPEGVTQGVERPEGVTLGVEQPEGVTLGVERPEGVTLGMEHF